MPSPWTARPSAPSPWISWTWVPPTTTAPPAPRTPAAQEPQTCATEGSGWVSTPTTRTCLSPSRCLLTRRAPPPWATTAPRTCSLPRPHHTRTAPTSERRRTVHENTHSNLFRHTRTRQTWTIWAHDPVGLYPGNTSLGGLCPQTCICDSHRKIDRDTLDLQR